MTSGTRSASGQCDSRALHLNLPIESHRLHVRGLREGHDVLSGQRLPLLTGVDSVVTVSSGRSRSASNCARAATALPCVAVTSLSAHSS